MRLVVASVRGRPKGTDPGHLPLRDPRARSRFVGVALVVVAEVVVGPGRPSRGAHDQSGAAMVNSVLICEQIRGLGRYLEGRAMSCRRLPRSSRRPGSSVPAGAVRALLELDQQGCDSRISAKPGRALTWSPPEPLLSNGSRPYSTKARSQRASASKTPVKEHAMSSIVAVMSICVEMFALGLALGRALPRS